MFSHVSIKVGGDFACFTRPGFPVDRVTYPVITPSAARGLLEAIFWKPEFRWEVREVRVLRPIKEVTILRNELSRRQRTNPIFVEEQRQQRASLILRDVEYLIFADMKLLNHTAEPLAKYLSCFERRVTRGQYYHCPYLGNREFPAWFQQPNGEETSFYDDVEYQDLGLLLFDFAYRKNPDRKKLKFVKHVAQGKQEVWGFAQALFFNAELRKGRMKIPQEKYQQLYEMEGNDA
jgi:CRISPR-associated protein Cas5d